MSVCSTRSVSNRKHTEPARVPCGCSPRGTLDAYASKEALASNRLPGLCPVCLSSAQAVGGPPPPVPPPKSTKPQGSGVGESWVGRVPKVATPDSLQVSFGWSLQGPPQRITSRLRSGSFGGPCRAPQRISANLVPRSFGGSLQGPPKGSHQRELPLGSRLSPKRLNPVNRLQRKARLSSGRLQTTSEQPVNSSTSAVLLFVTKDKVWPVLSKSATPHAERGDASRPQHLLPREDPQNGPSPGAGSGDVCKPPRCTRPRD